MRSLIAPVFCVAALLFVDSGALGQDTQPWYEEPSYKERAWYAALSYKERGQYHPCPASVSFNNRPACLGCPTQCRWLPSDLTDIELLALLAAPPPWSVGSLSGVTARRFPPPSSSGWVLRSRILL